MSSPTSMRSRATGESARMVEPKGTRAIAAFGNIRNHNKETDERKVIMENFSLSDTNFLNNGVFDAQHSLILSALANVGEYLLAGVKGQHLFEVLDKLDAYCKLHFMEEEKLMEEMDVSELNGHKAQHALFMRHLEKFIGSNEDGNSVNKGEELNLLKEWFMKHIVAFDTKSSAARFRSVDTHLELNPLRPKAKRIRNPL